MTRFNPLFIALSLFWITQACQPAPTQSAETSLAAVEPTATLGIKTTPTAFSTSMPIQPTVQLSPTPILPSPQPDVRVTAVSGNIYIRRGPGTAYDRVGILMSGSSAVVIGQDILSKWVQIEIPDSEVTGWVSLLTPYSQLSDSLKNVPSFTFNEWPQPAYIENCTEHILFITPGELSLYSLWTNSKYLNEVQVDPGVYQIYDVTLPDEPLIKQIDIREGQTAYITVNGLGVAHHCP